MTRPCAALFSRKSSDSISTMPHRTDWNLTKRRQSDVPRSDTRNVPLGDRVSLGSPVRAPLFEVRPLMAMTTSYGKARDREEICVVQVPETCRSGRPPRQHRLGTAASGTPERASAYYERLARDPATLASARFCASRQSSSGVSGYGALRR
jgi:hypothetical protein